MIKWYRKPYGKKLKKLHFWNAWVVVFLAVTGIILYIPSLRGPLAFMRVGLKEVHIIAGIVSVIILLLYFPLISRHVKQILEKKNQQFNLGFVLFLLAGWMISGIIIWQERNLPKGWSAIALLWHDWLTWIGIPYVSYHSISRSRWIKRKVKSQKAPTRIIHQNENEQLTADQFIKSKLKNLPFSRKTFLRSVFGLVFIFALGPYIFRWLKRIFDNGGTSIEEVSKLDGNKMIPNPTPLTESQQLIGGGAKGEFRIYTVTEIPSFSSDSWKFAIGGLVDKPRLFTWEEFLKIKRRVQVSDFHCVTGWSVYSVTWEGIPLSDFLDQAGVSSKAKNVLFISGDGVYTDTLSLEQARMDDVLVAVLMDGKPIPQKLGGPVRLVVPKMYAYKSVKWLQGIELIDEEHLGYWEVRGYDTNAWVKS
ncbi:molybdopterin-dependent oxidoreductase [Cytobacillus dafuensis]|nr:molybdopterin-dependent oxidoreductase [Cytobacillus dafuensis]